MKPWLYRLADEDNTTVQAVFGAAARHRAVEAVLTASRNPSRPGAADYDLLHSTLSAVWGAPVTGESVGGSSGRSGEPVRATCCDIPSPCQTLDRLARYAGGTENSLISRG